MENLMSYPGSSHKPARGPRILLPQVSAAFLQAGTELGVSLSARPTTRYHHHHHPAVGRSRIVKYKSSDGSCRPGPRLRLASHQQGLDHPGSLQRRMELLRLRCQGLGLSPDYFDGHPEDIDVDTNNHYPSCSGTTLMLGLPPPPTSSSWCCDIEDDASDAHVQHD